VKQFRTVSGFLLGCGQPNYLPACRQPGSGGLAAVSRFLGGQARKAIAFLLAATGLYSSWLRSTRIHRDLKTWVEERDHNEVATDPFLPDGVICERLRTRIEYATHPGAETKS
jgi:hypothetical protein